MAFHSIFRFSLVNMNRCLLPRRNVHLSAKLRCIAGGGQGTHKPTPFQQKILVWTKTYKSVGEIPDRITRSQMKNAIDKFRVRVSVGMVGATFISAAIFALIGRKERMEGKTVTGMALARREKSN